MSATITGGVATEVVDLLNFLVPVSLLPGQRRLQRSEFFQTVEGSDGRRSICLRPGALDRIGRLSAGRVSFLLDTDEASYPQRIFEGEPLPDPLQPGADIAYLRFTPCPMTPFHERTLARMLALRSAARDVGGRVVVPTNASALYDMAYPNPAFAPDAAATQDGYGLYVSAETPAKLAAAPTEWKAAAGVTVEMTSKAGRGRLRASPLISGPFLCLSRPKAPLGLEAYSSKYQALGTDLFRIIGAGPGKIMVYHHRVQMSGVLLIQEMLETNGLLDETTAPSPSTVCGVCGLAKRAHSAAAAGATWAGPHEFIPGRYVMINSEISRNVLERSIARYNARTNAEGFEFRVLVGSEIIREGFDLKAVRFQLIVSLPTNIPTLLQVFGRAVRKNSHVVLPRDQRSVRIRIYVSTAGATTQGKGPAPEVLRYAEKMRLYLLTQEVEKAIRRYAVDAFINYDRMQAADLLETPNIDAVPYSPAISRAQVLQRPEKLGTFEAYGHGAREVETLRAVIQALFETQPVWKYGDLWAAARSGRVRGVAQNPAAFSEASFALALDALSLNTSSVGGPRAPRRHGPGAIWQISRVGEFYIRSPLGPDGQPVLDIESYVRENTVLAPIEIRVADYVETSKQGVNFQVRLAEFETEFGAAGSRIEDLFARYDAEFHYAFLRAIIEGLAGPGTTEVSQKAADPETSVGRAVKLYTRFKVLVFGKELTASPAAKQLIRASLADGDAPVGYVGETAIRFTGRRTPPSGTRSPEGPENRGALRRERHRGRLHRAPAGGGPPV